MRGNIVTVPALPLLISESQQRENVISIPRKEKKVLVRALVRRIISINYWTLLFESKSAGRVIQLLGSAVQGEPSLFQMFVLGISEGYLCRYLREISTIIRQRRTTKPIILNVFTSLMEVVFHVASRQSSAH